MIGRLKGEIIEKNLGCLILDVNGVGYEVSVSPRVSSDIGSAANLVIYTDVKENAIVLYGFNSTIEKQTFLLLKKVKGIGSKLAMVVLSSMTPEELMVAIGQGNKTSLTRVPGIGKKSAERIILELREKVAEFLDGSDSLVEKIEIINTESNNSLVPTATEDAILALQKLGFSRDIAIRAVKSASMEDPKLVNNAGELLKSSLSYLG